MSRRALGPAATVNCPIREAHTRAFRGKREPGQVHKSNIPKRWQNLPVCCQDSITIDPDDHLQEQQLYRYGSDAWFATYRTDRNTMESTNNSLKSDFALDVNTERRMRGLAATQLVLAFKVAALNYNRIATYAREQLKNPTEPAALTDRTQIDAATPTDQGPKAQNKKTRSRDRNGWSNYRRNARPINSTTTPPEPDEPTSEQPA